MSDKILFVDDEISISDLFCEEISKWGYEIICANDYEDAMALFIKEKPFLVITDLQLNNNINGAIMADRMHRKSPLTIFIAFTGYIKLFNFGQLLGSVFTDILLKPVSFDLLKIVIDYAKQKHDRWNEYLESNGVVS